MKIIQEHIADLKKLCDHYHVAELYVFGSIVTGQFTNDRGLMEINIGYDYGSKNE